MYDEIMSLFFGSSHLIFLDQDLVNLFARSYLRNSNVASKLFPNHFGKLDDLGSGRFSHQDFSMAPIGESKKNLFNGAIEREHESCHSRIRDRQVLLLPCEGYEVRD